MNLDLDATHDPKLESWVATANDPDTHFPIQNLPLGVFSVGDEPRRLGIAIGDAVLDLPRMVERGFAEGLPVEVVAALGAPRLNELMALGRSASRALRHHVSHLLQKSDPLGASGAQLTHAQADVTMHLPAETQDYTDFYASIHHATNVGRLFRPDNPLLPNYKYVPIGYHGRASSLVADGTPIRRPSGQRKGPNDEVPSYGPCRLMDYELEVGFYVGAGNAIGETIPLSEAEDRLFGFCLVNDWSARDLQAWEYQPLGPFLAKSFATTVAPWVVTMDALEPFRAPAYERPEGDPAPLDYLSDARDQARGGIDLTLEVWLTTAESRAAGEAGHRLSQGSFRSMYWTPAQMLAHHSSNGCPMQPGDLMASGTVSGSEPGSQGCLLEITRRGQEPVELPGGGTRKFLLDGDEILLTGYCKKDGVRGIGFGSCRGTVLPAEG